MIIQQETFNKLCSSYQNLVLKLEKAYSAIPENETKRKLLLLKDFWQKYLMLKEFWSEYFDLLEKHRIQNLHLLSELIEETEYGKKKAMYQFLDYGFQHSLYKKPFCDRSIVLIDKKLNFDQIANELSCPSKAMERNLIFYQEYSHSPLPNEAILKFDKAKKLYEEINKAGNQKEWFTLIAQIENEDCICDIIDFQLGKDITNYELWKLYFGYLKCQNVKKLLHLYSRYCRFFIDDLDMKKEYEEAVKKYGPSIVFWKNPFIFETYYEEHKMGTFVDDQLIEIKKNNLIKISFNNYIIQVFPFQKTILSYIKEKCSPQILHKLHKSCKYFFILLPYPICHNFFLQNSGIIPNTITFNQQSIDIGHSRQYDTQIIYDHKLIISNTLHLSRENFLSITLPNIFKCTAKFIRLCSQNMSYQELKFLIEHGDVRVLCMDEDVTINYEEDKSCVELEEILKLVPKVLEFEIHSPITTSKTYKTLPTLNFYNKFHKLSIYGISYIEPYEFCKFLKKNLDSDSEFVGRLSDDLDGEIKKELKSIVFEDLNVYWPEKPSIIFF